MYSSSPTFSATVDAIMIDGLPLTKSALQELPAQTLRYVKRAKGLRLKSYVVLALAGCFFSPTALAETVDCPAQIEVQEHLVNLPATWNSIVIPNPKRNLSGVEFSQAGDAGRLYYDDETDFKKTHVYSYWFPDRNATYRVICTYGETNIYLIRDLPADTKKCDVTFTKALSGALSFKSAECF